MISEILRMTFRLVLLSALAVTAVAIGLGRASPGGPPPSRVASPPSYQVLDHAIAAHHGGGAVRLDLETGRLGTLPLPPGLGIDEAGLSPWEEDGRRQLVGVGWNRSGSGGSSEYTDLSLIRMRLPDGAVLDRLALPTESLPVGPPCWVPGAPASVLYVGGDFRLHRVDFGAAHLDRGIDDAADPCPRPLRWRAAMPGDGDIQFQDLSWPDGPGLGGRALASLRFKDRETGRYTAWRIWWLQLDLGGTSIVAAGPLLEPCLADATASRRLPNLVGAPGEPALSYLLRRPGDSGYQLRVAPIRPDPGSGIPHALEADSRPVAEDCSPTGVIASPDGGWVTIVRSDDRRSMAERIAIPGRSDRVQDEICSIVHPD